MAGPWPHRMSRKVTRAPWPAWTRLRSPLPSHRLSAVHFALARFIIMWRSAGMLSTRVPCLAIFLYSLSFTLQISTARAAEGGWPEGYGLAEHSESPDGP